MAAITTLDTFGGSSNPLGAGDGWTAAASTWLETGGVARPTDYAVDAALTWSTTFNETSSSIGGIFKVTLGTLTAGEEFRIYFRATNANDVTSDRYYIKILPQSYTTNYSTLHDVITVWKIVSTVHTEITQTLRERQETAGDLRHYKLLAGDSVTCLWVHDQIVVRVSATDPYGDHNMVDRIHCHVQDTSIARGNKYAGIWSIGGAHTHNVQLVQGQTVTTKWCSTTGSDSAAGTQAAPYLTPNKLIGGNVTANQFGFFTSGTYPKISTLTMAVRPVNGASWEDAPTYMVAAGSSATIATSGIGIEIKDGTGQHFEYMVFKGLDVDIRTGGTGSYGLIPWSQITASSPQRLRFQGMEIFGCIDIQVIFGTTSGTSATYQDLYHELIDCTIRDNRSTSVLKNNVYIQGGSCVVEYCVSRGGPGTGIKFGRGNGERYTNDNIGRFNKAYDNGIGQVVSAAQAGMQIGEGTGNKCYGNILYNNNFGVQAWGSEDGLIFNNVAYNNRSANYFLSGGAACGLTCDGNIVYNNTSYGAMSSTGGKGVGFFLQGAVTGTLLTNNISSNEDVGAILEETKSGCGSVSGTVLLTNHDDTDTTFGASFGDPLFIDPANGDFRIPDLSACLDVGTDVSATIPAYDFAGQARPQEVAWDVGAFEYKNPLPEGPILSAPIAIGGSVNEDIDLVVTISSPTSAGRRIRFSRTSGTADLIAPTPVGDAVVKGGL